ncbi:MAG: hypothetical protein IBX68_08085 [Dehalococcoidia bacterium]|nr:hypothetical protein [Dehalococcoidia bacterium]
MLVAGGLLTLLAAILALSLQFTNDHRWFWIAAPIFSLAGVLLAFVGSLLFGRWTAIPCRRYLALSLGGISGLVYIASGLGAFILAFAAGNYLSGFETPVRWSTYAGDYLVGFYVIRLLQLSVLTGIVSGSALGAGAGSGDMAAQDPA